MRSEQNLFAAWRHVKRSALHSPNNEIRGQAAEFEHRHQTHIHTIGRQLRENRFVFDAVTGSLKDKKKRLAAGKDPRPIAIGTLRNRVAQRAILQVLQPRRMRNARDIDTRYESTHDPRLGKINEINRSKFGVGGLLRPYGGVRPAIESIRSAIDKGGHYFFQSDIKAFFTKIPTQGIVDFVRRETQDDRLADLFAQALKVELANEDELYTYAKLFPSGGIGVAQGSSLSALAGNILLFDFDHELNNNGITSVRYINDLLMIASTQKKIEEAVNLAHTRLSCFGFSLYQPVPGSDKAAQGRCSDSFDFLGCTLQPHRCVPSTSSIRRIIKDTREILSASKAAISEFLRDGKKVDPRYAKGAVLQTIGRKLYGWQRSFAFCTDSPQFRHLDCVVAKKIEDYENWINRSLKKKDVKQRMHVAGIPNTEELFMATE
ncbi:MAG: reverse transcriptase domain-containing protein [Pseudomonadota bacterium]